MCVFVCLCVCVCVCVCVYVCLCVCVNSLYLDIEQPACKTRADLSLYVLGHRNETFIGDCGPRGQKFVDCEPMNRHFRIALHGRVCVGILKSQRPGVFTIKKSLDRAILRIWTVEVWALMTIDRAQAFRKISSQPSARSTTLHLPKGIFRPRRRSA